MVTLRTIFLAQIFSVQNSITVWLNSLESRNMMWTNRLGNAMCISISSQNFHPSLSTCRESISSYKHLYFFRLWFSIEPASSNCSSWPGCVCSCNGFDALLGIKDFAFLPNLVQLQHFSLRNTMSLCVWGHQCIVKLPASPPVLGVLVGFVLLLPVAVVWARPVGYPPVCNRLAPLLSGCPIVWFMMTSVWDFVCPLVRSSFFFHPFMYLPTLVLQKISHRTISKGCTVYPPLTVWQLEFFSRAMSTSSRWFDSTNLLFIFVIFCGREINFDHLYVIHRSFFGQCGWYTDWSWVIFFFRRFLFTGAAWLLSWFSLVSWQKQKKLLSASFVVSLRNAILVETVDASHSLSCLLFFGYFESFFEFSAAWFFPPLIYRLYCLELHCRSIQLFPVISFPSFLWWVRPPFIRSNKVDSLANF